LKGKKSHCEKEITAAYHQIQKAELFNGQSRVYTPKDDEGDKLPSENVAIRNSVGKVLSDAVAAWVELFDVTATQEESNQVAVADVEVDGRIVLTDVPVTTLLFLEKRLVDVITFIGKLPVNADGVEWRYDSDKGYYASEPTETTRTKKIPKVLVLYDATKEHPAQVQSYNEDVLVGTWKTIAYTATLSPMSRQKYLNKANAFLEAVKQAREAANNVEVTEKKIGAEVFNYILGE
jgi:hypothetical protein